MTYFLFYCLRFHARVPKIFLKIQIINMIVSTCNHRLLICNDQTRPEKTEVKDNNKIDHIDKPAITIIIIY